MGKILLKFIDSIFLLRLPLLIPVWTIIILGWITADSTVAIGNWSLDFPSVLLKDINLWLSLCTFSLIVASIYVVNQISDIESDRINHKLFILPNGLISIRVAWFIAFICAFTGLIIAFYYLDYFMLILYIVGLFLGVMYNLPPFNFKNRAIEGVIANFIGHGIVTYLVGYHATHIGCKITADYLANATLSSLAAGFANAAVFLMTTIPDAKGDSLTGKQTITVMFGEKNVAIIAAISCVFAFASSFFIEHNKWVMLFPSFISSLLFIVFIFSKNKEFIFWTFRWPVVILSVSVILFVPFYAVIIFLTLISSRIYYKLRFNYNYPTFIKNS